MEKNAASNKKQYNFRTKRQNKYIKTELDQPKQEETEEEPEKKMKIAEEEGKEEKNGRKEQKGKKTPGKWTLIEMEVTTAQLEKARCEEGLIREGITEELDLCVLRFRCRHDRRKVQSSADACRYKWRAIRREEAPDTWDVYEYCEHNHPLTEPTSYVPMENEQCDEDRDYFEDIYGRLWGFVAEVPEDDQLEELRLANGVYKERRAKNVMRCKTTKAGCAYKMLIGDSRNGVRALYERGEHNHPMPGPGVARRPVTIRKRIKPEQVKEEQQIPKRKGRPRKATAAKQQLKMGQAEEGHDRQHYQKIFDQQNSDEYSWTIERSGPGQPRNNNNVHYWPEEQGEGDNNDVEINVVDEEEEEEGSYEAHETAADGEAAPSLDYYGGTIGAEEVVMGGGGVAEERIVVVMPRGGKAKEGAASSSSGGQQQQRQFLDGPY